MKLNHRRDQLIHYHCEEDSDGGLASSPTTCQKERVSEEMKTWQPTNKMEHLKKNGKSNNKDGVEISFADKFISTNKQTNTSAQPC